MTRLLQLFIGISLRNAPAALVVVLWGCIAGCNDTLDHPVGSRRIGTAKILFDFSGIRADGLIGPEGGLRSVAYEFCVPNKSEIVAEIRTIDALAQFSRSPGRVGCGKGEVLVISETHQPHWRQVLETLSELDYVREIRRADFE